MLRAALTLIAVAALSVLMVLLVSDDRPTAGRVVLSLTPTHGVHTGDLPVLAVWAVGVLACAGLARRR